MIAHRPRRSALYLPASNPRAIDKSRTLACDVVILDLEDAVAPDAKPDARRLAAEAVQAGGFGPREVVVRVNGLDTPWGAADLEAVAACRPDAVLIPKISAPAGVEPYAAATSDLPVWVMIETCQAVLSLAALAAAARNSRTAVWVIGANDLAKEMRCRPGADRAPLLPALTLSVAAARTAGLAILDGVCNALDDPDQLALQCAQGAAFGFDGKTLIHPGQIEAANEAFAPKAAEVAWARTVAAAFASPEAAGRGVLRVEGQMVERLHLDEALRLIALAEAIARRAA